MEYTREIAEKALKCCCGEKNDCENCPLKDECESSPFESVIAKYAMMLVQDLKADIAGLETAETQNNMAKAIDTLTVERDIYREAANNYKNYIDSFGNYLTVGYEPSAAKYAAEMDMWRAIALDKKAREEELEKLYTENYELRSMINVSSN